MECQAFFVTGDTNMIRYVTPAAERLVRRLREIPDGEVSATARRAKLPLRHLLRLREGKSPDVRLSTLEKLAEGLREPLGWVIDDGVQPASSQPERPLDTRALRRLLRDLKKLGHDARIVEAFVPDPEK